MQVLTKQLSVTTSQVSALCGFHPTNVLVYGEMEMLTPLMTRAKGGHRALHGVWRL